MARSMTKMSILGGLLAIFLIALVPVVMGAVTRVTGTVTSSQSNWF